MSPQSFIILVILYHKIIHFTIMGLKISVINLLAFYLYYKIKYLMLMINYCLYGKKVS